MIACLRSARFMYPDRSASIFVELRRQHDTDSKCDNKQFVVTKRSTFGIIMVQHRTFATLPEARRHWMTETRILEDQGLIRDEMKMIGWHEED